MQESFQHVDSGIVVLLVDELLGHVTQPVRHEQLGEVLGYGAAVNRKPLCLRRLAERAREQDVRHGVRVASFARC
jgi:hypothetical protein